MQTSIQSYNIQHELTRILSKDPQTKKKKALAILLDRAPGDKSKLFQRSSLFSSTLWAGVACHSIENAKLIFTQYPDVVEKITHAPLGVCFVAFHGAQWCHIICDSPLVSQEIKNGKLRHIKERFQTTHHRPKTQEIITANEEHDLSAPQSTL